MLLCGYASGSPSAPSCATLTIDGRLPAFTTAPYFASFNVDSSRDRSFFVLNWSSPALLSAAAGLSVGEKRLRFGGTGNNALFYNFSGAPCVQSGRSHTCLNETTWAGVAAVAAAAQAPVVFGVNMFPNGRAKNSSAAFDPSNALQFFSRARARGDAIWGVELGNELGPDSAAMTAQEQAAGLLVLDAALAGLYGADPRPVLVGPDPLGFHYPAPAPTAPGRRAFVPPEDILAYLAAFAAAVGPRLHAVTHHEYIEINETAVLQPAFLDMTAGIARQVVAAVRAVSASVEVWAGEIGPHNGDGGPGDGTPGNCAGNLVCGRWGSALWYADAMAAKANAGYAAFCRQDYIGADYGLLNVTTLAPTPDYWLLALWQRLVGSRVLATSVDAGGDARLRAYSFCSAANGTAVVLLINLAPAEALCVAAPALASGAGPRLEYVLTPAGGGGGVTAPGAALNGAVLALGPGGEMPPLGGRAVPASAPFTLPPLSITLASFATSADACGGTPGV